MAFLGQRSRHGPRQGGRPAVVSVWGWLLAWTLWLAFTAHHALAASCQDAPLMLIHPDVTAPYQAVIDQLEAGLRQGAPEALGVCALGELDARVEPAPARVVAVGEAAYAAARRAVPNAQVLPILVRALPAGATRGLSRFVDPSRVLAQLQALAPATETLYFVHRQTVPAVWVRRAKASARALGLRWEAIAVADLRDAARAIETLKSQANAQTAVWFHRDVLALNPDILLPPIVRLSWERQFPVFSDDADTVERGLLFSLAPDYRQVGRAAGAALAHANTGLADLEGVHRILNRRTARAIGLRLHPADEQGFDHVHE